MRQQWQYRTFCGVIQWYNVETWYISQYYYITGPLRFCPEICHIGGRIISVILWCDRPRRSHHNSTAISRPVISPWGNNVGAVRRQWQYQTFANDFRWYCVETWYICNIYKLLGQFGSAQKFATLAGGYYPPLHGVCRRITAAEISAGWASNYIYHHIHTRRKPWKRWILSWIVK